MFNFASFLMAVVLAGSQDRPADAARLTGQIDNSPAKFVVLVDESNVRDTIPLTETGSFNFQKEIAQPQFHFFYVPDSKLFLNIFLENGTSTHVAADAKKPKEATITGELEPVYTFAEQAQNVLMERAESCKAECFERYDAALTQLTDSLLSALNGLKSTGFRTYEANELNGMQTSLRCRYFRYLRESRKPLDSDAAFNAYMESIDLNDPEGLKNGKTRSYLFWKASCQTGTEELTLPILKLIEQKITVPAVADELANGYARQYFGSGADSHIDEVYSLLGQIMPDRMASITPEYEKQKSFAPGKVAPDFEMTTPDGKRVRFSDLRGKAIYLDIWATWCGPCRKEIPFMEKLARHYEGSDRVSIVSISVDSNVEDWKALLQKDSPQWPQYIIPGNFQSPLLQLYGIKGIPRFMMFDKDGRIISINAPRPSAETIMEYIDSHTTPQPHS